MLDGELVAWKDGAVQPFAALQQRIGRKKLSAAILESVPVHFLAYDLLEQGHEDLRALPLRERRARLEALLAGAPPVLALSPLVVASSWEELAALRAESRSRSVEGLMLKAADSPYGIGRQRGAWWKWKIEPYSFDARDALRAARSRPALESVHRLHLWGLGWRCARAGGESLFRVLSNAEILELDRWIRAHTTEKFGPVRQVEPSQVFELAYEGIAASTRHKSGIGLRFPRILRRRTDKAASAADTLANLQAVLGATSAAGGGGSTA